MNPFVIKGNVFLANNFLRVGFLRGVRIPVSHLVLQSYYNYSFTAPKSIDGHKSVNRLSVNNEANLFINSLIR